MADRVALDANILIVLAFGAIDITSLGRKRRVKEYMPEDYQAAIDFISGFKQVVVTPNVVTECSDLLSDDDDFREKERLKLFLQPCDSLRVEEYVPSYKASLLDQYSYLGIADCSLLSIVDDETVLLTADSKLYVAALNMNPNCVNFNHLRNYL